MLPRRHGPARVPRDARYPAPVGNFSTRLPNNLVDSLDMFSIADYLCGLPKSEPYTFKVIVQLSPLSKFNSVNFEYTKASSPSHCLPGINRVTGRLNQGIVQDTSSGCPFRQATVSEFNTGPITP